MNMTWITQFIDASKLGGYVRGGVASILGWLLAHYAAQYPLLADVLSPQVQVAIGLGLSTAVVGLWSQFTKTDTAKLAAVAAMPGPQKEAAFAGIPDSAKLAAVEAIPAVTAITVKASAIDGVADALSDPNRPKVVAAATL